MSNRPHSGTTRRIARISLSVRNWGLLYEALATLLDKPYLQDLEEDRARLRRVLRSLAKQLEEQERG